MKEYKFYVSYAYTNNTKGQIYGFGSCYLIRNYDNVRVKDFEAELNRDLKKEGIADNVVVLNVLPEKVKGTKN